MAEQVFDAVIIGGGPGGTSAAMYLRQAGKSVVVLEKERFPRFHIGESLLPYNKAIFAELGVLPKLEKAGMLRKWGAQFHLANGSKCLKLVFRNGKFTREPMAFQVERAIFDKILLDHAKEVGAEVHEGCTVTGYSIDAHAVSVQATDDTGTTRSFRGRFLIDASGRGNFTGNVEKLREVHPHLKKLAVFGHFRGVKVDPGEPGGDTVIVRLENKWFWLIPLNAEKTSVGCVMNADEFARARQSPEVMFDSLVQGSTVMREKMAMASAVGLIQTTSDFSYRNRRLVGTRLLRVGDAAGFMDPIFSAGVYLAMYSGKLAAGMVADSLASGDDGSVRFKQYEKRVLNAMKYYWQLVEGYYTTPFMELFLEPREKFNIPSAVTALLAGEIEGGWMIRWRLALFFLLIKFQARFPLVPRITFREPSLVNDSRTATEAQVAR